MKAGPKRGGEERGGSGTGGLARRRKQKESGEPEVAGWKQRRQEWRKKNKGEQEW